MVTRRTSRPLSSFLLRVAEQREERLTLRYELRDLRGGTVRSFSSLAALARFLKSDPTTVLADPVESSTPRAPRPPKIRK